MVDEIVRLAAGHLTARLSRHALGEMKFDFVGQFRAQINHHPSAETEERAVASLARADSDRRVALVQKRLELDGEWSGGRNWKERERE